MGIFGFGWDRKTLQESKRFEGTRNKSEGRKYFLSCPEKAFVAKNVPEIEFSTNSLLGIAKSPTGSQIT